MIIFVSTIKNKENMKTVSVKEKTSVKMFNVTITEGERSMCYEVICYDNEVKDIRDQYGDYLSYWSDDDELDEEPCSKEWLEIENIVNEYLK